MTVQSCPNLTLLLILSIRQPFQNPGTSTHAVCSAEFIGVIACVPLQHTTVADWRSIHVCLGCWYPALCIT